MPKPAVSVVIPNYNHARYLPARLESVLGQSYTDFEVIFLDDASTDDSIAVFDRVAGSDPRVRKFVNAANSGSTFKQWNQGVRRASGEYVWIAESDDVADPRFLEVLVCRLVEHPAAVMAYCRSAEIGPEGAPAGRLHPRHPEWQTDYVGPGRQEIATRLARWNTIPNASAVIFKRSAYLAAGLAKEELKLVGDWVCWIDLCRQGDLVYVAEPLNGWRSHAATVRSQKKDSAANIEETLFAIGHAFRTGLVPRRIRREIVWDLFGMYFLPGCLDHLAPAERRRIRAAGAAVDPLLPVRYGLYLAHRLKRWIAPRPAVMKRHAAM